MKRNFKLYLLIVFCWTSCISLAQNLIPNGLFNAFTNCPNGSNMGHRDKNMNIDAINWIQSGSTDFFHSCSQDDYNAIPLNSFGHKFPKAGNGYLGLILHSSRAKGYKEYLKCQLSQPLIKDSLYYFEFYLSMADVSAYSLTEIQCLFSDSLVEPNETDSEFLRFNFNRPEYNRKSGSNWIKLSTHFKASGGECFLTIGNFLNLKSYKKDLKIYNIGGSGLAYCCLDCFLLIPVNSENKLHFQPRTFIDTLTFSTSGKILAENSFKIIREEALKNPSQKYQLQFEFIEKNNSAECIEHIYNLILQDDLLSHIIFLGNENYMTLTTKLPAKDVIKLKKTKPFVLRINPSV